MDYNMTLRTTHYADTPCTTSCVEALCLHENKEFYSKDDVLSSGIAGYCIDCGAPFSASPQVGGGYGVGGVGGVKDTPPDTSSRAQSRTTSSFGGECNDPVKKGCIEGIRDGDIRDGCGIHVIERCTHPSITEGTNGIVICSHCFVEIEETISFEPEWNNYTASSRSSKDPSRCYRRKTSAPKGIKGFFDSHNIKIDKATIARIERKYAAIVSKNGNKAECRGGIIAACLFKDFRNSGNTRTTDYIMNICGITRKEMSKGLLKYYACFTEESNDYIQPEDLLPWLMSIIGIDKKYYQTLLELTRSLVNINPVLKRSTPQSVASSIIYFFLCINPTYKKSLGINKTTFAKKSELSDVTITRLVTLISENIGCKIDL
jgi:transcription initiation factor TFIIIB Brf1 subunit/transcription initiation factor TFIIB